MLRPSSLHPLRANALLSRIIASRRRRIEGSSVRRLSHRPLVNKKCSCFHQDFSTSTTAAPPVVTVPSRDASGSKKYVTVGIFRRALQWYSNQLDTRPLLTKAVTGGIISGSGDFLCQVVVRRKRAGEAGWTDLSWWDKARTARFTFLGAVLVAPCMHYWYNYLASAVPGKSFLAVTKRVFYDEFIFTPIYTPIWLLSLYVLEGERDYAVLRKRLVESYPSIIVANWCLWVPVQWVNFRYLPVKYQLLFTNIVDLVWYAFLSFSEASSEEEEARHGSQPFH